MDHDGPDDVRTALDHVKDNLLELLRGFEALPSSVRIQAGGVTLDAEWPQHAPPVATALPVAAPPAATATAAAPATAATPPDDGAVELGAPSVGTFYRSPEPGAKPFAEVGDKVAKGDQVAIIEVMKLMIPVEADRPGTIIDVLAADGDPVEYGTPLFRIATDLS